MTDLIIEDPQVSFATSRYCMNTKCYCIATKKQTTDCIQQYHETTGEYLQFIIGLIQTAMFDPSIHYTVTFTTQEYSKIYFNQSCLIPMLFSLFALNISIAIFWETCALFIVQNTIAL